ncbi:MAG TPA: PAS domain S-box protein, partial [Actinopolymorphaceae bacterium]|nr:PAS domain S-box protein [Actinopolymorphaceae bacterium]
MGPSRDEAQTAHERLRAVEAILDAITNFEIIKLDATGHIASWSRGGEALKGYTADEVIGRPVAMFYTPAEQNAGAADRELQAARETGRVAFEAWRVRKNGERFWASVTLAPIRDDSGEITGFVKVTRDLSQRREQEERLQRQPQEILELSTPVLQVWDRVLVLPIIGSLDSTRAVRLTEAVLQRLAESQNDVLILEVSGLPIIDSQVAQHLLQTVQAAALMGTVSI